MICINARTELWISDFQHIFFSLACWTQASISSYCILASVPNIMVKERVSNIKQAENIFAALRKNRRQKLFWTGIKSTWKSC